MSERDRRDRTRRRVLRGLGIAAGVGFVLASAAAIYAWIQPARPRPAAGRAKVAEEQTKKAKKSAEEARPRPRSRRKRPGSPNREGWRSCRMR